VHQRESRITLLVVSLQGLALLVRVYVCVCVCVCERERERERESKTEIARADENVKSLRL